MKKWSVLLISVFMLAAGFIGTAGAAIQVEGDTYAGIWDKYMWRGFNISNSRPTIQAGIDLSAGGFTLSTWHNWQLSSGEDFRAGELNETDIILTYAFDLGEMVSISVGDIFYSLDMGGAEDTNELFATATLNTLLSPNFKVSWDWDAAEEDGMFYSFDISHSFDIAEKTALNLGALVSYNQHCDSSVGDYAGWHNYELSASLDYALTDQLTLSPIFILSSGISSSAKDAIDTETAGALNLTFTF
ncbi:hypothetical protein A7E78_06220 [Syntrophotalea acetylenivorans]|uniref:Uncharacterized protein n=1 Tax=Syntrophotalea acetylenivorans TaxID=1842532 RepID=A0A1L3GNH7_9BACT|nr:TorF family putative porin [Syntrophotalea acetylenivorans]APG27472.1 hypothetical protein A7E78_06220 [Syntrophotalea acetylenivorans]